MGAPKSAAATQKSTVGLTGDSASPLHQLDDGHLGGVAAAGAHLQHPGVAAVAVGVLGADLWNSLLAHILLGEVGQGLAVSGQVVLLGQSDHLSAMGATSFARA